MLDEERGPCWKRARGIGGRLQGRQAPWLGLGLGQTSSKGAMVVTMARDRRGILFGHDLGLLGLVKL